MGVVGRDNRPGGWSYIVLGTLVGGLAGGHRPANVDVDPSAVGGREDHDGRLEKDAVDVLRFDCRQ